MGGKIMTDSLTTSPAQKYFLEFADSLVTPSWQVLGMFEAMVPSGLFKTPIPRPANVFIASASNPEPDRFSSNFTAHRKADILVRPQ
jgi:hypothetical protein